jgi:hypothetical protein
MPAAKPLSLAVVLLLILLGWSYRPAPSDATIFGGISTPASSSTCPQVLFDTQHDDGQTGLSILRWDRLPEDTTLYAFATPKAISSLHHSQGVKPVKPDTEQGDNHYLVEMRSGWLYVVAMQKPTAELTMNTIPWPKTAPC